MDVVLLTEEADFDSVLPTLGLFTRIVDRVGLDDAPMAYHRSADLAIVDTRTDLPGARDACRRLAATATAVAVVAVVTATDLVAVDVDWGFDDVLLDTASAAELQARLRLAIARRRSALEGTVTFGDLVLYPASYTASLDGQRLDLTLTEFKLLNCLVQHAGQAFSRARLMREVWGQQCSRRTVDVHVQRLRAKLGAGHKSIVDTVRGVGYMAAASQRCATGQPVSAQHWWAPAAGAKIAQ